MVQFKALKIFKEFEKEDEKWRCKKWRFFRLARNILIYNFSEALNFADFKYLFGFFISFFDQKIKPSKVGPFCLFFPILDIFCLLWRAVPLEVEKWTLADTGFWRIFLELNFGPLSKAKSKLMFKEVEKKNFNPRQVVDFSKLFEKVFLNSYGLVWKAFGASFDLYISILKDFRSFCPGIVTRWPRTYFCLSSPRG